MLLVGAQRINFSKEFGDVIPHPPSGKTLVIVAYKWSPESLLNAQNAKKVIEDTSGKSSTSSAEDNNELDITNDDSEYSNDSGSSSVAEF